MTEFYYTKTQSFGFISNPFDFEIITNILCCLIVKKCFHRDIIFSLTKSTFLPSWMCKTPNRICSGTKLTRQYQCLDILLPRRTRSPFSADSMFNVVDVRLTQTDKITLKHGHPRMELATTLLASVGWMLRLDDFLKGFACRAKCSMSKLTTSPLQNQWRKDSTVE